MNAKQLRQCLWIVHMLCGGILNAATFEFSSPSSKLVLGDCNGGSTPVQSYFKNYSGSTLIGWDQQSIVRGHPQANTFTNSWTCSVVGGTVSAAQVTYDLVVSASNMTPLVRATSNALLVVKDIANRGLGLAGKAACEVLGLQQGIAQTAFDFTGTTTGVRSYSTNNSSDQVYATAWHPGGNLLAIGVGRYAGNDLAMGAVSLRYCNADFDRGMTTTSLPLDIRPTTLSWHPAGEDLLVGGMSMDASCGLLYRSGLHRDGEASLDSPTITAVRVKNWVLVSMYMALSLSVVFNQDSETKNSIALAIDLVKAANYASAYTVLNNIERANNYAGSALATACSACQNAREVEGLQSPRSDIVEYTLEFLNRIVKYAIASAGYFVGASDVLANASINAVVSGISLSVTNELCNNDQLLASAYAFQAYRVVRDAISLSGYNEEALAYFATAFSYAQSAVNVLLITPVDGVVNQVAYSKDGQNVAVVGRGLDSNASSVVVYKQNKFSEPYLANYTAAVEVVGVAWHPSGDFIAVSLFGVANDAVDVLRFDGRGLTSVLSEPKAYLGRIKSVAWDATGKYLAIGGTFATRVDCYIFDGYSSLVNISNNITIPTTEAINVLQWSPDGNALLCAHHGYSLYAMKNSVLSHIETRQGYANPANALAWATDGRSFVLAGQDLNDSSVDMQLFNITSQGVGGSDSGIDSAARSRLDTAEDLLTSHGSRITTVESGLSQVRSSVSSMSGSALAIEINQSSYEHSADTSISNDKVLKFKAVGGARTINFDGKGHRIMFARGKTETMQLEPNVNAIMRNVVLNGFDDNSVKQASGARLTFGDGAVVELGTDAVMKRDWECAGRVTIRGFGSTLDLSAYVITVKKDTNGQAGKLIFEDIVLAGVETKSFSLAGEEDSITLRDARINMAKATIFARGALRVEHNVTIGGQQIFKFTANNPLTIASNSVLTIDAGAVFAYAPTKKSRTLLVMEDAMAQLVLNGCYFYAPAPGIQLCRGMLVVKSNNNLYNPGAKSLSEAITLGNGTLANNLFIDIHPGASLNVIEGKIDYRNVIK